MAAYTHYVKRNESDHPWSDTELVDCTKSTLHVLNYNDGMFSPLNRTIICPEQYFDMEIEEPWAKYSYKDPHSGEELNGILSIKGSVDLLTEVNKDTLEYLDWKNGRRFNWGTFQVKEYKDLERDPQLLMYYYALTKLYPKRSYILTTIFYANDGGPFCLCFDKERDLPYVLGLLERRFNSIRNNFRPKRRWDNKLDRKRICQSWCYYGKNSLPGSDKPMCEEIHKEFVQLGMDRTIQKYGKPSAYLKYGSGGGITNREEKPTNV